MRLGGSRSEFYFVEDKKMELKSRILNLRLRWTQAGDKNFLAGLAMEAKCIPQFLVFTFSMTDIHLTFFER